MDRRRYPPLAVCLLLLGSTLSGCASAARGEPAVQGQPSRVEHIPGSDRSRVLLTADAAKRVGITTVPIAAAPTTKGAAGGHRSVIPLSAILYDKDGRTWTYTEQVPLTFVPIQVTIARIDGDLATFTAGPAVGTPVVTVGGAELLGAEYGVPGEQ
ncbi:MAG TPA: hypothetical protein VGC94_03080 [Amnibacterium sp.]|jgi:hypothetical protein